MSQSTAQPTQKPSGGTTKSRVLGSVTVLGVVVAVIGVATLAGILYFFSHVYDLSAYEGEVTIPRGFFAISRSRVEELTFLSAIPGGVFLVAGCLISIGRVFRGGVTLTDPDWMEGGTVVSANTYLSPRHHLAWLGVALAFWIALIPVPVLLALGGGWPTTVRDMPQNHIWANLVSYGAIAAGLAGCLFVSHLKKQHYLALAAADNLRLAQPQRAIWRQLTFRWRIDLWLGSLGGAFFGASWAILPYDELGAWVILMAIGVVLLALGVLLARQYWRAKLPLGLAESVA